MTSAHEIAVVAIAAHIVARQRELDRVMRADLLALQRKHGAELVMRACAIADHEFAAPAPRRSSSKPKAREQAAAAFAGAFLPNGVRPALGEPQFRPPQCGSR